MASDRPADASVRPAGEPDVPAIAAVQSRAWRSAYAGLLGAERVAALTPDALEPPWRAAVGSPPSQRHIVLVATAGGLVIGFAAVGPASDPDATEGEAEIGTLAVDPAHQRAGHGSRLLSAAADILLDGGFTAVQVWTPEADRPRRDFLASAGLLPDGARRSYPGPGGEPVTEIRYAASLARG